MGIDLNAIVLFKVFVTYPVDMCGFACCHSSFPLKK